MTDIKTLNELIDSLAEQRALTAAAKNAYTAQQECEAKLENEIMEILNSEGLKSFKGSAGTVTVTNRFSVKFPKDPETKEALRSYLEERGEFQNQWSINYQALNSWFKTEMAIAEKEGRYLDIPGLEPTSDQYISFKSSGAKA